MPSWSVRVNANKKYIGMRVSGGKVYIPNKTTLGYGKYNAEPGDFISWRDPLQGGGRSDMQYGRVLGRISSHDSESMGGPDFVGQIAVLWFHLHFGHASLRIVKPEHVTNCYDPNADKGNLGKFLNFMLSVDINPHNIKLLAEAEAYGSLDYHYVNNAIARVEGKHEDS